MKPILEIQNISKKYKLNRNGSPGYLSLRDSLSNLFMQKESSKEDFWALNDVSFSVNPGDSVGIIGRNGAGKSTLLKIISRITPPTSGKIISRGRIASLLEVGTGFHPELSGRENIFLNGSILGLKKNEISKHFDSIVDFSGVSKFLDNPLKHYSSGMQLRLAFAVAAHLEPEILIIDEVLAVGDAEFQKRCMGKMEEVSKSGRTILFVSHNIASIQQLCNKAVLLKNGQFMNMGETRSITEQYIKTAESTSVYHFEDTTNSEKPAFAYKLSIEDSNNNPLAEIPIGAPWNVKVSIRVNTKVKNLVIGVGMVNSMEVPIRTCWSIPQTLDPGNYTVKFTEDNIKFSRGIYRLLVGLSIGSESIQYVDKNIFLNISDAVVNMDNSVVNINNGVLLNQMNVYVEKDCA